jgi:hypothetical protein
VIPEAVVLLAALALGGAEDGTPPPPPLPVEVDTAPLPPKGADLDLVGESRQTAERVERIRGIRFAGLPPPVRAGEDVRKEAALRRVGSAQPPAVLSARGRAWAELGLGGEGSPRRLVEAVAADLQQIGYDPDGRRLLVDPSALSSDDFAPREGDDATSSLLLATGVRPDEPALAHMLMHALQRGRTGAEPLRGTTDELLAACAWAEGEANLVATLLLFEGMGIESQVLERALDPGHLLGGSLLPASLDVLSGVEGPLLDFVYREGYVQAAAAYRAGGWKALDKASSGRRSTRDVLHPNRTPLVPVAIPDPVPPKGSSLVDRDSLGEQGIVVLVSLLTGKDNLGMMAGDGWAADALFRFEPEAAVAGGDGQTVWITRWISEEEAADFEYGVERSLSARFPGAALTPERPGERKLLGGQRVFRLARTGQEVTLRILSAAADALASPPPAKSKPTTRRKPTKSK